MTPALRTAVRATGLTVAELSALTDDALLRLPMCGPKTIRDLREHVAATAQTIVITRHTALVAYLIETGVIAHDTPVLAHATPEDVRGRHVVGVLPLSLAALAVSVTEVPLALTPEDRGRELGIERMREIAGAPVRYTVRLAP